MQFEKIYDTILNYQADLVGLNEIRGEGPHPEYRDQTGFLSKLTGLSHSYFAQAITLSSGPYGNALLSKIPIRERMKDTASAFRQPLLSFPSDEPTIKIDYIFVSPDVQIQNADIPACVASDHRAHTASLFLT